jgi:hypothetical protein
MASIPMTPETRRAIYSAYSDLGKEIKAGKFRILPGNPNVSMGYSRHYAPCTASKPKGYIMCDMEDRRVVVVEHRSGQFQMMLRKHKPKNFDSVGIAGHAVLSANGTCYFFWGIDGGAGQWDSVQPGESKEFQPGFTIRYLDQSASAAVVARHQRERERASSPNSIYSIYVTVRTDRHSRNAQRFDLVCDWSEDRTKWPHFKTSGGTIAVGRDIGGRCEIEIVKGADVKYKHLNPGNVIAFPDGVSVTHHGDRPPPGWPKTADGNPSAGTFDIEPQLLSDKDVKEAFENNKQIVNDLAEQIERDFYRGRADFSDFRRAITQQSMLTPPPLGPVADLCNSIQYDLALSSKCECGAASTGIGKGMAGHSGWCPWKEK